MNTRIEIRLDGEVKITTNDLDQGAQLFLELRKIYGKRITTTKAGE